MRRKLLIFGLPIFIYAYLLIGCKDDDDPASTKTDTPTATLTIPGLSITDDVVYLSVSRDSSVIASYTVTTSAAIRELKWSVSDVVKLVGEAKGLKEYSGALVVTVPYEEKELIVGIEVTDEMNRVSEVSVKIYISQGTKILSGGSSALAFTTRAWSDDSDVTITTDGSGGFTFGEKLQAAPVLLDEVDNVFENGVRNPVRDDYTHGQPILITKENANEVYTGRGGSGFAYFEAQGNLRVPGRPVYRMPGSSNTFHHPKAGTQSPYPMNGDKSIYVAWHVRSKYDARLYNRYIRDINGVALNSSSGFIGPEPGARYGETVSGNGLSGRIIGISDEGISFEMIPSNKAPEIGATGFGNNVAVVGETSGATFTTNTKGGEDVFRGEGSNKWLRVWSEDGGNPTIRISWTQSLLTAAGVEQYDGSIWKSTGYQMVERWVFMEFLLTPERATARLDGTIIHDGDATQMTLPAGVRLNIGMIGFNGNDSKTQITQETHVSDIYLDHSLKRFYLANAPTVEASTKVELQRLAEWDDQTVKFKVRLGNLDPLSEKIYLIYADGINETASVAIN